MDKWRKFSSRVSATTGLYISAAAAICFTLFLQHKYMKGKYRRAAKDLAFMKEAATLARNNCNNVSTAFNVGCVIVSEDKIIATGYSREVPGNTHAEEVALNKLAAQRQAAGITSVGPTMTLYTTMEPCSKRLSGKMPCVEHCIQAKGLISRIVIGTREPENFVKHNKSQRMLSQQHGIEITNVIPDAELLQLLSELNSHL